MKIEQNAQTLVELLQAQAQLSPYGLAYVFLPDGEGDEVRITYSELDTQARRTATQLAELLAPGSRVLLVFEPGLQFIVAFFGCLYAGIVAVPAYPPTPNQLESGLASLHLIAMDCAAKAVLTSNGMREFLATANFGGTELGIRLIVLNEDGDPTSWRAPRLSARSIAMLQYTSGSTMHPRGVILKHSNILANQRAIHLAAITRPGSTLSWLPPYHDMGLIGFIMQPLYMGEPSYILSPLHFLQKPVRWLNAITRYRIVHSGGPPFAYDLCARRVTDDEKLSLDLSSWEVAFVGAEPVRSEGLTRFVEAFAMCGFRQETLYPCYGLAEATLLVTGATRGAGPVVLDADPEQLAMGLAAPADSAMKSKRLISSGRAPHGHEVVIVDPAGNSPVSERHVGEVWVASASVAEGYWTGSAESASVFGATLPEYPGRLFLRTGDLGFIADGELFITGRIKELLIVRGRNVFPQDLETIAQTVDSRLRPGCGAAFNLSTDDSVRVALVQETTLTDAAEAAGLLPRIRQDVLEREGVALSCIALVPARTVPKTSSGKVRRLNTRNLLIAGQLPTLAKFDDRDAERDTQA